MKNFFVSPHIAKLLDNEQYNEHCIAFYTSNDDDGDGLDVTYADKPIRNSELVNGAFTAPTYQQVVDWFRQKHDMHIVVDYGAVDLGYSYTIYYKLNSKDRVKNGFGHDEEKEVEFTYYQALKKAIEEALKLI